MSILLSLRLVPMTLQRLKAMNYGGLFIEKKQEQKI